MNELEIKSLLQAKLASSQHGQGAAFVSELFIDAFARRADLVMANGKLSAFEIKSEKDTLDRLDGQLETYLRLFEQVTVVCAERHQAGVEQRVPDGVGVWVLAVDGSLRILRKAKTHKQASHQSWLSFLPVDELRSLLAEHGLQRSGPRDALVMRASSIALKHVRQFVLDFFKNRRQERIEKINAAKNARALPKQILSTPTLSLGLADSAPLRAIPRLVI
ncbi:sce7726 family protein [Comamonas thiooxydans]|uniref:Sce7726 family protein n=1 Tax=Comamonas thiooxydans TaxID=363952 RepID=A0AA42PXP5_9BURK|nr:sce7726 family protein [Comamonas thiooxydans]MDH1333515.1 sce7726 family protein [Comamonas thiooxydans]MDH1738713.1 sce7726 family protein [Comamonas thiooxydans]MDH1788254.1 sce7726 family protein [Comamonas thiooxydans]